MELGKFYVDTMDPDRCLSPISTHGKFVKCRVWWSNGDRGNVYGGTTMVPGSLFDNERYGFRMLTTQ